MEGWGSGCATPPGQAPETRPWGGGNTRFLPDPAVNLKPQMPRGGGRSGHGAESRKLAALTHHGSQSPTVFCVAVRRPPPTFPSGPTPAGASGGKLSVPLTMAPDDPSAKEETPVPGTAAKDGRRKFGAYIREYRPTPGEVQAAFFQQVAGALSVERLESYGADEVSPTVTLARYLLNMALCESLYSPLQLCEVALRNSHHWKNGPSSQQNSKSESNMP